MSCIDTLGDRSPCIYRSVLSVGAAAAIAALAIGVITILANQHLFSFTAFSINTPISLAMCTAGSFILGGILILALRHCCKPKNQDQDYEPSQPNSSTQPISGGGGTGAPPVTQTGQGWDIEPGAR